MARLVVAAGVPHPPRLVRDTAEAPGKTKGEALMKQVRRYVEKAEPDVIIEVDSDHFVNFFYNNLPSFCIGMGVFTQSDDLNRYPSVRTEQSIQRFKPLNTFKWLNSANLPP